MKFSGFNTTEKVGIGTTTPTVPLDVYGAGWGGIDIDGASGGELRFQKAGSTYGQIFASNGHGLVINAQGGLGDIFFQSSGTTKMTILDSGNVGIGTTAPAVKLDIYEPSSGSAWIKLGNISRPAGMYIGMDAGELQQIYVAGNNPFTFWTNDTEKVRITGDGKVGIGTVTPLDKLHVQGNILQLDGSPEYHFGTTSASHFNWRVACQEVVSGGFEIASGTASAGTGAPSDTYTNRFVIKGSTGQVQFNSYGGGTHTGTSAYKLSVDSSGNIIETSIGSGAVDGAGTTNYISKWTDGDTIGNSIIQDNGTGLTITGTGSFSGALTAGSTSANYWVLNGNSAGQPVYVNATGSDTNIGFDFNSKGTGNHRLNVGGTTRLNVSATGLSVTGTGTFSGLLTASAGARLMSSTALLGQTSGTASTQLIWWSGTTAYYGRTTTAPNNGTVTSHVFRAAGNTRLTVDNSNITLTAGLTGTTATFSGLVNVGSGKAYLNYTGTAVPYNANNQALYSDSYAIGLGGQWATLNMVTTAGAPTTTAWWMFGRQSGANDKTGMSIRRGGGGDEAAYFTTTSGTDSAKTVSGHKWFTQGTERVDISSTGLAVTGTGSFSGALTGTSATFSGNLSAGGAGSTWVGYSVIQVKAASMASSGVESELGANVYYNSGWKYYNGTVGATLYEAYNGVHKWKTAPSGTVNTAVTLTDRMSLSSTGLTITGTGSFSGALTASSMTNTLGSAVASTNLQTILNGVASKANRIKFQEAGVDKWLLGQGAASETSAFELYNAAGVIAISVNKTSNLTTLAAGLAVTGTGSFSGALTGTTATFSGIIQGGPSSTGGGVWMRQNYSGTAHHIGVIGNQYSTGAITLGYAAVGKAGGSGYTSTLSNFSTSRSILQIGSNTLNFLTTAGAVQTAVGSDLTMVSRMSVSNTAATLTVPLTGTSATFSSTLIARSPGSPTRAMAIHDRSNVLAVEVNQYGNLITYGDIISNTGVIATGSSGTPFTFKCGATTYLNVSSTGLSVTGTGTFSGNVNLPTLPSTTVNAAVPILFRPTAGTLSGDTALTWNPAADSLDVNGTVITQNHIRSTHAYGNGELKLGSANGGVVLELTAAGNATFSGALTGTTATFSGAVRVDNTASTVVRLQLNNTGTNDYASIYADTATAYKNLILNPTGGNVGIGTTAPTGVGSRLLHIQGGSTTSAELKVQANWAAGLYIENGDGKARFYSSHTSHSSYGGFVFEIGSASAKSGTEIVRFKSDGNVGIGATSPSKNLHIKSTVSGSTGIIIENTNNAQNLDIDYWNNSGAVQGRIRYSEGAGDFYIYPNTSALVAFAVKWDGKVGIGTDAPYRDLQVGSGSGNVRVGGGAGLDILHDNGGYTTADIKQLYAATNAAAHLRITGGFTTFCTGTNGAEKVRIQADGKVGIGTAANLNSILNVYGATSSGPTSIITCLSADATIGGGAGIFFKTSNNHSLNRYGAQVSAIRNSSNNGSADLVFNLEKTDASGLAERVRFLGDGKVGIGTNAPTARLTVDSDTVGESLSGGLRLQNSNGANNDISPIYFGVHGGTRRAKCGIGWKRTGSYGIGKLLFALDNTGDDADVSFANDTKVTFQGDGNVGIGTAAPSTKLQVNDTNDSRLLIYETGASPYTATLELSSQVVGTYGALVQYTSGAERLTIENYGRTVGANNLNGSIAFKTKLNNTTPTEVMLIQGYTGYVGIGTTAPAHKLDVVSATASDWLTRFHNTSTTAPSGLLIQTDIDTSGYLLGAVSAGVYKLVVLNNGNVGIGTVAPGNPLTVVNSTAAGTPTAWIHNSNNVAGADCLVVSSVSENDAEVFAVRSNTTTYSGGDTDFIVKLVSNSPRVGIGTATPPHKLSIFGTGASNATVQIEGEGGADPYINFLVNNTTHWALGADDSDGDSLKISQHSALGTNDRVTILTDGKVGIGTTAPAAKLHIIGPSAASTPYISECITIAPSNLPARTLQLRYDDGGSVGNAFSFAYAGTRAMMMVSNGNFGIGNNASPTQALEIYKSGNDTQMLVNAYGGTDNTTQAGIWFRTDNSSAISYDRSKGAVIFQRTGTYGVGKLHLAVQSNADNSSAAVGDAKLTIIQDGNVGIGTTSPSKLLHVNGDSLLGGTTTIGGNLVGAINGLFDLGTTGVKWRNLNMSGTATIGGALAVTGTLSATGQAYLNGGLRIGGANSNFAGERLFNTPYFTNAVANQKLDLYWTGAFWGYLEIEITGSYSNQNMAGVLTKSFALGLNASNGIYTNESWYSNVGGVTNNNFAISDVTWDSTNSRYRIQIVHRTSTGNGLVLKMRCLGATAAVTDTFMSGTTVSAIYTTDTTTFALPVKQLAAPNDNAWVDGYLGIGTATPDQPFQVKVATNQNLRVRADSTAVQINTRNDANSADVPFYLRGSLFNFQVGSVGIGTTAPARLLHLYAPSSTYAAVRIESSSVGWNAQLEFKSTAQHVDIGQNISVSGSAFEIYDRQDSALRLLIDTSGDVGIGTTAPGAKLDVHGSTVRISSGGGAYRRLMFFDSLATPSRNNFQVAVQEIDNALHIGPSTAVGGTTFSGSTGLAMLANGSVGIGTAAPDTLLNLQATAGADMLLLRTTGDTSGVLGAISFGNANLDKYMAQIRVTQDGATDSAQLQLQTQATGAGKLTRMTIKGDGKVGFGTTSPAADVHFYQGPDNRVMIESNGPTLVFKEINSTNQNWAFYHNAGALNIRTLADNFGSTVDRVTFLQDGNVGIGDTAPSTKLTVLDTKTANYAIDTSSTWRALKLANNAATATYGSPAVGIDFSVGDSQSGRAFIVCKRSGSGDGELIFGTSSNNGTNYTQAMTLEANGTATFGAGLVVPNGGAYGAKDTSGTFRQLMVLNSANALMFGSAAVGNAGYPARFLAKYMTFEPAGGLGSCIETMRITNGSFAGVGSVGIGTSVPSAMLHVYGGGITISNDQILQIGTTNGNDGKIRFYGNSGTAYYMDYQPVGTNDRQFRWFGSTSSSAYTTYFNQNHQSAGHNVYVDGTFTATGTKNFEIDHPTKAGMKLVHSSLEGPEVGVYYRGRAQSGTITLPDYWVGLVRDGTVTVQLTPNGSFQHLYVVSTSLTEIKIGAASGETIDCYYVIYGERANVDRLIVEKYSDGDGKIV